MPTKKKKNIQSQSESDSAYILKLVLYIVLGSFWLKFHMPIEIGAIVINAIPVGLFLGIVFASHDHFQVDRKIEYAILILMTVLSYFLPSGIVI